VNPVVLPWLAEIGLITWRDMRNNKRPPLPSELLATFVVFGTLSLIPQEYGTVAGLAGWGFVVATLLNAVSPSASTFGGILTNPSNSPTLPGYVSPSSTTSNIPPSSTVA
jgi:hypothetical protein